MPAIDMIAREAAPLDRFPAGRSLATLCYQSRASRQPSTEELDELLADARTRNKRFGVTGMLIHEGDRFFQWLEGPGEALKLLWSSISRDNRHADVELLGEGVTPARLFSDWDLRFLDRDHSSAGFVHEGEAQKAEADPEAAAIVLARLALADDDEGMAELIRKHAGVAAGADLVCRTLLEPAAHQLGDWWCEDVCSSFDITLALGRLQSLVRRLDARRANLRRVAITGRSILVSPPPRETHMLGATLLGGFFERAGWSVQAEFPQGDADLIGLVRTHWFDALALTLSDVFTRRDRLAALIQTIKDVRTASKNPLMAIIVGGRAFRASHDHVPEQVGADVHYASAAQAVSDLDYWLFMHRFAKEGRRGAEGSPEAALAPVELIQLITPNLKRLALRKMAASPPEQDERRLNA